MKHFEERDENDPGNEFLSLKYRIKELEERIKQLEDKLKI